MQNRTKTYFRKYKALKVFKNPLDADLSTFLKATLEITRNNVVKKHISETLNELSAPAYKLTA